MEILSFKKFAAVLVLILNKPPLNTSIIINVHNLTNIT